jgi:hypothetical protein
MAALLEVCPVPSRPLQWVNALQGVQSIARKRGFKEVNRFDRHANRYHYYIQVTTNPFPLLENSICDPTAS